MKRLQTYVILLSCMLMSVGIQAQSSSSATADSLQSTSDSLVQQLRNQVQELELQGIMMREQLERTGQNAREDSLRMAERKARIDSLRQTTTGAPLIIEGDTLFTIYARKGGMLPQARVEATQAMILETGKSLTLFTDSIYVYESDITTDIMAGERVVMSVTDNDALWQNTTRQELAAQYGDIISRKVNELHEAYGLQEKLKGVFFVIIILVVQGLLIWFTNWCFRRWKFRILHMLLKSSKPLTVKGYEVLNRHRLGLFFAYILTFVRIGIIFLQLLVSIPLLFSVFPETKAFAYKVFGYIWDPFTDIIFSVIGFLPNFFKIVVIVLCFRYLVKAFRYLANEVGSGNLKINGFYADWAEPTFLILRILCYSFMFVMIWPLLPSSDSEVFQGVSVFIGVIVSLGSSSIIGNVMAGMMMTYMRPFHIGDFIRYGDTEGFVIEKTVLVTRIRTRKNEIITIPNSNLMSSQTSNFTFAAKNYGVIVHTKVTIGYDMKWQLIRDLLLEAARQTPYIVKKPEPYVRITALDDFYVEYEINAYTHRPEALSEIYSELHQHILDSFHSNGVEIMSPHIMATRDNLETQIPKE
ncbi:MAG: mechanosensitive ion channel family protein [Prevotella sp.]|nr:mechanosensitive ion channel family protein [Prevotella sp.]